jgi:cephalosporin-C deacetylase-like acetyl esterase
MQQTAMRSSRLLAVLVCSAVALVAQPETSRSQLVRYLNSIAQHQLEQRAREIAAIQTQAQAEQRKSENRQKILNLMGGLPETRAPLSVQQTGTLSGEGFRLEKIIYDSLPGFHVTANVCVPEGKGPFPAVLLTPGHYPAGKLSDYSLCANLARNGMIGMAYDPMSEGERLQYYDADLEASKVGGPTAEHSLASMQTLLIGDHLARYFIWDAMRGIDYLASRPDVDATKIGAFGCSGGGTVTAYLAALDDRVKAAASACYITSFEALLQAPTGVQEAEQSIPDFIKDGLDFADWVEMAAPKPYAIVSTTEDMFPFAGARQTYEEAKRIYGLYGAADRLHWITGPGRHGALGPVYPQILAFFVRYLKGGSVAQPFTPLMPSDPDDILCTPSGQVSTSLAGETIYSIDRERAQSVLPKRDTVRKENDLRALQTRLCDDIRRIAAVSIRPGATAPLAKIIKTESRQRYQLQTISLATEPGIDVAGLLALPNGGGKKPAFLLLPSTADRTVATMDSDLDRLANSGHIVLVLYTRPSLSGSESLKSQLIGPFYLLSLHAMLVGKTFVGMQIEDTLRALDWLCARSDVDLSAISAYGDGAMAVVLLHAAVLDDRIHRVYVEHLLASYHLLVDRPLSLNAPAVILPGVLRQYDIGDLAVAIGPRPVTVINPVDGMGKTLGESAFAQAWARIFASNASLGNRLVVLWREPRTPLPIL